VQFYLDLAMSGARERLQTRLDKGKQPESAATNDLPASLQALRTFEGTIKRLLEECKDSAARRMGRRRVKKGKHKGSFLNALAEGCHSGSGHKICSASNYRTK
jgi:hypothetical protein